jgi:hypothetical protein
LLIVYQEENYGDQVPPSGKLLQADSAVDASNDKDPPE